MRSNYLVLLSLLLLLLSAAVSAFAASRSGTLVGGWSPIKNISDPHVAEIADFAVNEYDKQSGKSLKLVKVVKGETQVVAGTNYRLLLTAEDESKTKDYEAVVWEKAWEHFRNLTSFRALLH